MATFLLSQRISPDGQNKGYEQNFGWHCVKKGYLYTGMFIAIMTGLLVYHYLINLPTNLVALHRSSDGIDVVVTAPSVTHEQTITWWQESKPELINQLTQRGISRLTGRWYIWDYGEGYKPLGKEDRICFLDKPAPDNCLDKKVVMWIEESEEGNTRFTFEDAVYERNAAGKLCKPKI